MKNWYLGTIGFSYKDWVGPFYPAGYSQRNFLSYYCKYFNSVELDTTFYSIPQPTTVQSWFNVTPVDFRFSIKTPRRITHELGLKGTQGLMLEFLDSLHSFGEKLGPILIQLPPKFTQVNYSVLAEFLESLPKTHKFAIEFRHASWYNQKTIQLLSNHKVCWVTNDFPNLPNEIIPTSNFLYIRWIGVNGLYHHHTYERVDKTDELRWWLDTIRSISKQIPTIYGFFNNDYAGFAAGTCKRFNLLADLGNEEIDTPYQSRLF
jgi:uncharacterized protein YecE (DUF72 family)